MTSATSLGGLAERYGEKVVLDGVDLDVDRGAVCELQGPNGAGRTAALRITTTLVRPDAGRVEVAGIDVVRHPRAVRRRIGLIGQQPAVDDVLVARQNLVLFGRLHHLGRRDAGVRADELLEQVGLVVGSGKSSLVLGVLPQQHPDVVVDRKLTRRSTRSNTATWTGMLDTIRKAFAKENGVKPALSSANSEGACLECMGLGQIYTELAYLDTAVSVCETREGRRFTEEVLGCRLVDGGGTVIVVEHDLDVVARADWVIDLGRSRATPTGGRVVFQGTPGRLLDADTLTAEHLRAHARTTEAVAS